MIKLASDTYLPDFWWVFFTISRYETRFSIWIFFCQCKSVVGIIFLRLNEMNFENLDFFHCRCFKSRYNSTVVVSGNLLMQNKKKYKKKFPKKKFFFDYSHSYQIGIQIKFIIGTYLYEPFRMSSTLKSVCNTIFLHNYIRIARVFSIVYWFRISRKKMIIFKFLPFNFSHICIRLKRVRLKNLNLQSSDIGGETRHAIVSI